MAEHKLKLSVVIPAHNEEDNIRPTVEELHRALGTAQIPYEIIVVNDNSSDDTEKVIARLVKEDDRLRLLNRSPPAGFGRAIRSGMDVITGDVVAVYMADQSDDPRDLIRCYGRIEEGYDCAFGSRFVRGAKVENYPTFKLLANRMANRSIQLLFWTRHNDLTNAFKVYRTHVIRECGPYQASHFNLTIEMSLSALIRGYSIAVVPINWYGRTWGSSNLSIKQMGRRYLSVLLKLFFEKTLIRDDLIAEKMSSQLYNSAGRANLAERIEALEATIAELARKDSLPKTASRK